MTLTLRTTISINMLILMIAAMGLISIVVFRVSEKEIRLQQQNAADQVFVSISTTLTMENMLALWHDCDFLTIFEWLQTNSAVSIFGKQNLILL